MKCPHCDEVIPLQADVIVRAGPPAAIAINSPLAFTVADTQQPGWPALREAMLDNIRDSYRQMIEDAMTAQEPL